MFKKLLLVISFFIISCAYNNLMVGNGAKITSNEWNEGTGIVYDSYSHLIEELKKEAKLKMWSDEDFERHQKLIPIGGIIMIDIIRSTIGSANTNNFTVIIMKDELELQRYVGKSQIATPSNITESWINYLSVPVNKTMPNSFHVYIVDDLRMKRYYYKVTLPN